MLLCNCTVIFKKKVLICLIANEYIAELRMHTNLAVYTQVSYSFNFKAVQHYVKLKLNFTITKDLNAVLCVFF